MNGVCWEGEEEILFSLCVLSHKVDLPICTATQVNRNIVSKIKVDIIGSIEKIFKADVAIAIFQTHKEEIKNRIRLCVVKN